MAWVNSSPIHNNTFASLCVRNGDIVTVNDDCLAILEDILRKLLTEDCNLRTFRRAIAFGQNIRKDLIPLLIYVKDDTKITDAAKIIDTTIKILVNLTIPVEYLLSIDTTSCTDVGKHTIFELNRLLTTSKEAFTDSRSTKAVVDHIKFVVETEAQLSSDQCDSINNCLLLLRNILHIPETVSNSPTSQHSSWQNQIIWNLFTQSIDKIIIYLMSCPQKMYWGVTIVQLIALMYKDQHVGTLQKLLNLWLEASFSESSDDNESNTSPPDQGSGDSSPIITSDPTSDSSDNGSDRKQTNQSTSSNSKTDRGGCPGATTAAQVRKVSLSNMKRVKSTETETSNTSSGVSSLVSDSATEGAAATGPPMTSGVKKRECPSSQSEISDCGYVTQVENQESISTSSNDDDQPHAKPVHQKPHSFQKTRYNNGKTRTSALEKKELRRKKLVKRSKTNIIKMKGLVHHLPTDEDIANILKEFTVDFLLKGYGSLVQDLNTQLLTNIHIQIDTSHFFWLVTYFLKFATQLELDLEHVCPVLSYDILSYLIFQGVWVYEELEIICRLPDVDLKPCLRRLHLVITAIREFLQAVENYQKMIHLSDEDRACLLQLQLQITQTDDLKNLFVLLLRQYNPNLQSRQYLQDLILTNHNYLLFLDNAAINTGETQQICIIDHLKQFATVEIMRQYGLLLENFKDNGEFVNNCIFTMMHHIGGDLKHITTLFQPSILKTFLQIWETDYEICDDWSDLIEYVIHKFINTPRTANCSDINTPELVIEKAREIEEKFTPSLDSLQPNEQIANDSNTDSIDEILILFRWTKEEKDHLLAYYNQSVVSNNCSQNTLVASIKQKYEENGMRNKTQLSIIRELLEQNIINEDQFRDFTRDCSFEISSLENEMILNCQVEMAEDVEKGNASEENSIDNDIRVLRDYFIKENKIKLIMWLQELLLETCFVKLVLSDPQEFKEARVMKPTVYYFALLNLPIPVVPWTTEQTDILRHQPFVLLLHKLGFYLPVDTGKIFVRIPNFWTADYIFSIAQQLGPVDPAKLKFDINKLTKGSQTVTQMADKMPRNVVRNERFSMDDDLKETPSVVRYTPLPNSTDWFKNILQSKLTPLMDAALHIPSTNQLSIAIPEPEAISCPPPDICLAEHSISSVNLASNCHQSAEGSKINDTTANMECSPIHQPLVPDITEQCSICDTASVASDLTRMCVSDEEEKLMLVIEKQK